mgnify:CR=1 FL=1
MTKDNIMYLNKNSVSELDVKNPTQKRRLCIGISKFYIKVAHVFAAIVATIKPVYSFKPSSSDIEQDVDLSEKDKCMKRMRDFYSKIILDKENFSDPQKAEYFYFCMDDSNFKTIVSSSSGVLSSFFGSSPII